ncbi:MAG: hypothetical protein JWM11_3152 [Planctomycetaceae bacterium]|nr:hypothetical protein [Planctomycetaceae bacterium]
MGAVDSGLQLFQGSGCIIRAERVWSVDEPVEVSSGVNDLSSQGGRSIAH